MNDPFALVGTSIDGRYRVDAVIGEGGFGVVYRGQHERFDHPIAIKCLKIPEHFAADAKEVFLGRFREEGKILLKLGDAPGVPRVYDYGLRIGDREIPYLVIEWLDGQTLEALLDARRASGAGGLPASEALALLLPAIDAIATAHANGVAHRDIKPANLFLATAKGRTHVKVLDFGIAKAVQEGEAHQQAQTRTATSFRAFTPNYAAPEQFATKRFGASGPWTDVHALGLVLCEMLTGRPANPGEDLVECLEVALAADRPTPRRGGAHVSDALEAIVARAVALQPAGRWPDGAALAAALREVPEVRGVSAAPDPSRLLQPLPAATAMGAPWSGAPAVSAQVTEQPVMHTVPGGAARIPSLPQPPAKPRKSPVVGIAFGVVFLVGSAALGVARLARNRPPAPATASSAAGTAGDGAILAESLLYTTDLTPVVPIAASDDVVGRHHVRVSRQGGKIVRVETLAPTGIVRSVATIRYPAEGGWEKTLTNGRGVLVETASMSAAGIETRRSRAGSPFVGGCSQLAWKIVEGGRVAERTCQDGSGRTIHDGDGCAIVRDEYDARHVSVARRCLDEAGKPIRSAKGAHLTKMVADARGRTKEWAFFDEHDQPAASFEGCLRVHAEHDDAGNETERRCVGAKGETLATRGTKLAFVRSAFDERGCEARLTRYDSSGAAVTLGGVAAVIMVRDEHCDELSRTSVDQKDEPVAPRNEASIVEMIRDAEGKLLEEHCYGPKRQPTSCAGEGTSIASVRKHAYDDRGREISVKSFSDTGPSSSTAAYPHEVRITYDDRGLVSTKRYFDEKGAPKPALATVAEERFEYDALGAETASSSFGVDGLPVPGATRVHRVTTHYDARHRVDRIEVFDTAGAPPASVDLNYAGMAWPKTAIRLEVSREADEVVANRFVDRTGVELAKVDCRNIDVVCIR